MQHNQGQPSERKLLVFNCHEAWVYQLGVLGYDLDIIVGLKGRYKKTWDRQIRPVPPNSRLITLSDALQSPTRYYCIITHNITDLLDVKHRPEPRLIVLHSTIEGRFIEEKSAIEPQRMKDMLHEYLELIGGHAVATSMYKGESWGFTDDIVTFGVAPDDYLPYSGRLDSGLRISNFISKRKRILLWDLHQKAFADIPVRLVGHNPDMPTVTAAKSWADLKEILQSHRFYIHTADPRLEAGYNMATGEAMAAGLPVLSNRHPTSPIEHGVSGFLSDDPQQLREYAKMLLHDRDLAVSMGKHAQNTVREYFSLSRFKNAFLQSIETARLKCSARKVDPCALLKDMPPLRTDFVQSW
ncbi:MAG: glycosyltransferase [Planctomycetota bacterium]|nr:MAG: glycosyltransferase [Planctomycetota bacterium]